MSNMAGKSIVVTGGGNGIGREVALLLVGAGAMVTVADLNGAAAARVVEEAAGLAGKAQASTTDVGQESEIAAMVESAVAAFGRLDGACNAAGKGPVNKVLHEMTAEEWDQCQDINLRGSFLCMKHQVLAMLRTGGGSIVNIGSTAGIRGFPHSSEYCSSKAGLMGLVRGAAVDYATSGVRINAVLPGATLTSMMKEFLAHAPEREAQLAATHPMARLGKPIEIASAVKWLLSDEASFVTGIGLPADGGHSAA